MTKEEILKAALNGLDTIVVAKQFILQAMEEYANLRLSEQKEKHDKEMEEFCIWFKTSGFVYLKAFQKWKHEDYFRSSSEHHMIRYTFTELLTKFKNR